MKHANSAFDSNISTDQKSLHGLFRSHEFESKASANFVVYLELLNNQIVGEEKKNSRTKSYRVKYDTDMNLIRIETMPIKWLNIDVRAADANGKDTRFSVISEKLIELAEPDIELQEKSGLDKSLNDKIRAGILKELSCIGDGEDNEKKKVLVVNPEFRSTSSIFARSSNTIKYFGTVDNWKSLFSLAKVKFPSHLSSIKLLENIRICLCESDEYGENDPHDGQFKVTTSREELIVSFKIDVNELSAVELQDLVVIVWHVAQVFGKILN